MTTGIQANGTDLDSLFLPRQTTKRADVNIKSNTSVDISNRFEKYTSGTKVATTNIQSGATDLKDLFQNISVPIIQLANQSLDSGVKNTIAAGAVGYRFNANGTIDKYQNSAWSYLADWCLPTSSADTTYQIYMHIDTQTGGTAGFASGTPDSWVTVGASCYWTLTDTTDDAVAHYISATASIRKDAGATITTGTFTYKANYSTA